MPAPLNLLIYGHDPALLETRRLVLLHSAMDVTVALGLPSVATLLASRTFDLFILCHTLSIEDCEHAVALARSLSPGMKVLILNVVPDGCLASAEDAILSAFVPPRTLIDTIHEISDPHVSSREAPIP